MSNTLQIASILVGVLILPVSVSIAIYMDNKKEKKATRLSKESSDKWLKEELLKPKYKVVVKTKSGKKFETKPLTPFISDGYFDVIIEVSSIERARNRISKTFEQDYYEDYDGLCTPMCEIESIQAVLI